MRYYDWPCLVGEAIPRPEGQSAITERDSRTVAGERGRATSWRRRAGQTKPVEPAQDLKRKAWKTSFIYMFFFSRSFQDLLKLLMSVCVNINSLDYTIYM